MSDKRMFWLLWIHQIAIGLWLAAMTFVLGRMQETIDVMNHNIGIATELPTCEPIGPRIDDTQPARIIEL